MKKHTQENSTLRDEPIFESRQHGIKTFLYKLLSYLLKIDNEHVDFSFFEILFITQLIKKHYSRINRCKIYKDDYTLL